MIYTAPVIKCFTHYEITVIHLCIKACNKRINLSGEILNKEYQSKGNQNKHYNHLRVFKILGKRNI